jgi:hypothetical protein
VFRNDVLEGPPAWNDWLRGPLLLSLSRREEVLEGAAAADEPASAGRSLRRTSCRPIFGGEGLLPELDRAAMVSEWVVVVPCRDLGERERVRDET